MSKSPSPGRHRFQLGLDILETRQLPSAFSNIFVSRPNASSNYANQAAQHDYDQFVSELQRIELNSSATPAQYNALRDDSRALTEAVSASASSPPTTAQTNGVIAATLLIDRSLLQGWLSDQGWTGEQTRMTTDLAAFNVPPALITKAIADMKASAQSANVDPGSEQVLMDDLAAVQAARTQAAGYYNDPNVYYTQHLRGFFRGWATQKAQDQAALAAEVNSVAGQAGAHGAVVRRDVSLISQLGDAIPSDSNQTLTDAYVNLFSAGTPGAAASSSFRTVALSALGATANAARTAAVDQLIADAPAFFAGTGGTSTIQTLVNDVVAVVNDGQGAPLNPFKITILPHQ